MKKLLSFILAVVILTAAMTGTAFGAEATTAKEAPDIKIIMDGKLTKFSNVPVSINGSNLLPLRELLVNLGVPNDDDHIIYKSADKSITIIYGQTKIQLKIGDKTAYVNDKPLTLNAEPILYKNSTYIPIRFVAEALGKKVVWDGSTRTILVCDTDKFEAIQQLLIKSNESEEKLKKYKMSIILSADSTSGAMKTSFGIGVDASVDKIAKKMYMEMLINMLGFEFTADTYFADNASYTSNPFTGQWTKKTYTEEEYDEMFTAQSGSTAIKANDVLCAGLSLGKSNDDGDIVLVGDIYMKELFNNALEQQSTILGTDGNDDSNDAKFDTCELTIILDKDTYLKKSLTTKLSKTKDNDGRKEQSNVTITIYYSSDSDFEVTVPAEVIEKAVEGEDSTFDLSVSF